MKTETNNPAAFPLVNYNEGMTLRDYFAAKAMNSLIPDSHVSIAAETAKKAYAFADAMLIERSKILKEREKAETVCP